MTNPASTSAIPVSAPVATPAATPGASPVNNNPESPARKILRSIFGYEQFRGPQERIITTVMAGRSALVLMPTGGGKSLCYQIPALLRPGVGIVISPLIALMQDQVDALQQLGVRAGFLNSSLTAEAQREVIRALNVNELDVLYVAPERLNQDHTIALLKTLPLALFAIDEAHCVSQWGHDFRADYLQLSRLQILFPDVPRIALTATADAETRAEISERLGLQEAEHFVSGFDRPNIQYRITQKQNPKQQLLQFLHGEHQGDAGIVYCLSRRKVEETADWLQAQGFNALPYHAGLPASVRMENQHRFLREESVVIVATIAFGMGIDKPDVRFIVHLDLPKSLEAYYQETGRAGRDGEPATAWLVYGLQDVIKLRQMMEASQGNEKFKRVERARLDAMLGLCEISSCRRQALLRYFGEEAADSCGNCDVCLSPAPTWDGTEAAQKALSCVYRTGQRFGVGYLIDVLRGADAQRIFQNEHQHLSTFGIGRELSTKQWQSVFRQLVARGYLNVDHAGFGGLYLAGKARDLLRGDERIALRVDTQETLQKEKRVRRPLQEVSAEEQPLWEALRRCRKQLADANDLPPYVIFHDATLRAMLQLRPISAEQMLNINGVGQRKLDKYGAEFLRVIKEFE
ncbi:MAG: DNA helicase RecQ [Pseudomonadales bacterium]|nr:DNA helicase RecQ [Pseudomonadales bacterium]